jgi:L-seryl-tRNA(Ser) seleniumtransferase
MVHGSKAAPRQLPSLDRLLRDPSVEALLAAHGRSLVAGEARALLATLRARAIEGLLDGDEAAPERVAVALGDRLAARAGLRLRRVVNLTGVVVHTNLGRAVLAEAAMAHVASVGGAATNVEYDLEGGARGERDTVVEGLLQELTGAEAATVVNNNAAAVLLVIAALARGREVVVSRGELVEIGGSFRMPDVMESAGARLVEVGTTNRTHLADYARAIGPDTGLVLKVHTSNYAVQGFTASVGEAELATLAHERGVPFATDLGSGALVDLARWGLPREPLVAEMVGAGCDAVTFSGDKLLGGPQAGLIVGRQKAIDRIRRFPMKRALRIAKLPLAALEATLALYRDPDRLAERLPTLRLLTRAEGAIRADAESLCEPLATALGPGFTVRVVALQSQIGSGSLPVDRLDSAGLACQPIAAKGRGRALEALALAFRRLPVPVLGRVADDRFVLDLRCLERRDDLVDQLDALRASLPVLT